MVQKNIKKEEKSFSINIKVLVGVLMGAGFVVTVSAFIFGTIYNTRDRKAALPMAVYPGSCQSSPQPVWGVNSNNPIAHDAT